MLIDNIEDLTRADYERFRGLVYQQSGINLGEQKMQLVRARLGKRLRAKGFTSYGAYFEYVQNDASGSELTALIDAISTNTTHLFRENQHFEFLTETVKRWMNGESRERPATIRIWSAGCSSGEEPYSIVMTMDHLHREFTSLQYKVLATDISTRMLERAQAGIFATDRLATVPAEFKRRYFTPVKQAGETLMQINADLRRQIRFARFNLMDDRFPFRNGLDVIFCRNVMIYFDRPTQESLVRKFSGVLNRGGYLLIGHSESLNSISHELRYVMPTVYRKA